MLGNTDAILADQPATPEQARGFVAAAAARSREMLGPDRVAWLTRLPMEWRGDGVALVHATPGDCWAVVPHDAPDDRLRETYGPLGVPVAVYGHIHRAYVRRLDGLTVVNGGSLSLALDSDVRATYAVIDDGRVEHRRVEFDVDRVAADLIRIGYPNAAAYAKWLRTGAWTPSSSNEVDS